MGQFYSRIKVNPKTVFPEETLVSVENSSPLPSQPVLTVSSEQKSPKLPIIDKRLPEIRKSCLEVPLPERQSKAKARKSVLPAIPKMDISLHQDDALNDDDFGNNLDCELQHELENAIMMDRHKKRSESPPGQEIATLTTELKNSKFLIASLQNQLKDLQEIHDRTRNDLVEIRKMARLDMSVDPEHPETLLDLKSQLLKVRRENEQIKEETDRRIGKLKAKLTKIKMDSAVKIFELEEKLKGTVLSRLMQIESKRLQSTVNALQPLPNMLFPSQTQESQEILLLKKQIESKNQLIMDLSLQLSEKNDVKSQKSEWTVKKPDEVATAAEAGVS